jgi:hypothetical protein
MTLSCHTAKCCIAWVCRLAGDGRGLWNNCHKLETDNRWKPSITVSTPQLVGHCMVSCIVAQEVLWKTSLTIVNGTILSSSSME